MTSQITTSNPLARTLAHYERELEDTLERCDIRQHSIPTRLVEGVPGLAGKAVMLRNALHNAISHRNQDVPNLQIWPSLGLLEAKLWCSRTVRNIVSIHDPVPLRRQVGFDQLSRRWASSSSRAITPLIMVHSDDALRKTRPLLPRHDIVKALHPIRGEQRVAPKSESPTVYVAGQYKPERDLTMLAGLGPRLAEKGIQAEIFGRGWPSDIPGWTIHNRFVHEAELDDVLGRAWAVLLPYDLYFQSGIAIRALEQGTLTVTPRTSFAEDLLGADSAAIIGDSSSITDTLQTILATLELQSTVTRVFERYRAAADVSWRSAMGIALA